jgi:DNA-directed RNA polymerase subunit beta
LLEVPHQAFEWFCFKGIREVFDEVFPIISNDENFELHFNDYEIVLPSLTVRECFDKDASYNATLRGVFSFRYKVTGEIKEQEVFIAELPFMTRNGTFVINGVERVVVNQMVRAPGVYFSDGEKRTANEDAYMVKLIPYRGAWLRFEYDVRTDSYVVRMDSPRRVLKIPIFDFFAALGFQLDLEKGRIFFPEEEMLKHGLTYNMWPEPFLYFEDTLVGSGWQIWESRIKAKPVRTGEIFQQQREAQVDIWRKLHPTDPFNDSVLEAMLPSRFFDPKRYDLARVGRHVINQKLGLNLPASYTTLTVADMFEAFKGLHYLLNNEYSRSLVMERAARTRLDSYNDYNEAAQQVLAAANPANNNQGQRYFIPLVESRTAMYRALRTEDEQFNGEYLKQHSELLDLEAERRTLERQIERDRRDSAAAGRVAQNEAQLGQVSAKFNKLNGTMRASLERDRQRVTGYEQRHLADAENNPDWNRSAERQSLKDDIDHLNLENRRVEHVGEQLVGQLRKGLLRVERIVREKMMLPDAAQQSPKTLINTRPIIGVIKEFFGSSQMSQFMDNTNPLTSLTHKRRFSALGPKGLTREAARFDFRDVHHSHYGRICPIESPEGPNIGLISSLSTFARVNEYGFIETPFFRVELDPKTHLPRVTDDIVYLDVRTETGAALAPSTTQRDKDGYITEPTLFVRHGGSFTMVAREEVRYVEVAPNQFISVTTSLIPFLEHDDANRALMGSNMQRQAVPLLYPDNPIVGTGIERKLAEDAGGLEISPFCGEVTFVDSRRITLRKGIVYDLKTAEILDLPNLEKIEGEDILTESKFRYMFAPPDQRHELYRKLPYGDRGFRKLKKSNDHIETIWLRKFARSNQGTLINQRVQVRKGFAVIKGDLLADGASTHLGELSLGQNCVIAFMSWRGYNFEDAILVSEKMLKQNRFTSIHVEKHECEARQTKLGPEKITREITGLHEDYIDRNLDERGIIRVGAEVKSGDVLVGKITPKGESDLTGEEKLIRAVFGDKGKGFKNTPLKVPHGEDGVVVATSYFSRDAGDELAHNVVEMARVYVVKRRILSVGDKMAGRHGNKGVVSNILPEEDMPFLPDGTSVEIILNPLGVPSRMNIGQVLENHLGLACSQISMDDEETVEEIRTATKVPVYPKHRSDHVGKTREISFTRLSNPLKVTCPVFLSPSEDKIRSIFQRLDLPLDGKTVMYDGLTGESFKERVMVGVMYFMKLNHLVDDKIHARSTGSYALITQQPLGGKAQFGGQRLGEMEVWALEGYGAAYLLKEMLTVKSDDVIGRNNTYKAIVDGKIIPEPGIPESFYVMVNELKSLGLDVVVNYKGDDLRRSMLEEEPRFMGRRDEVFER